MNVVEIWLEHEGGWQQLAGTTRLAIDEQHAYQPPLAEAATWSDAPAFFNPEHRALERALTILAPHLNAEPLYRQPHAR
ncbi:hypothetical protein [Streptomyces sp. NPDC005407]|uniref:hypothetical protein n=1 Tax=Streptomyces sp. NPDC005407 TaxID=3155340 RepID=UPI0033BA8D4F